MTKIIADDGDENEPDGFDQQSDPNDEPEGEPEPAKPPQRRDDQPSYRDLMDEVSKLRERTRKNNQELAKRRQVAQWMETHGIEDLDSWLGSLGVDRETGQRTAPAPAPAPPAADGGEFDRRLALETERLQAQHDEAKTEWETRHERLSDYVKRSAVETALTRAGFSGTIDRALRVMDLKTIAVSEGDDGEPALTGVDEAVTSLKGEIPEWFRQRNGPRPRAGGEDVDGGRKAKPPPRKPTWEEQALGRLTGQR